MRKALIMALTAILLAACMPEHEKTQQKKLEGEISSLSAQVAVLSAQVAALQAQRSAASSSSWVLWRRIAVLKSQGDFVATGPAPARPWGAFDSKGTCEKGAHKIAAAHGAPSAATEYIKQYRSALDTETDRIFFTCLPRGVSVNF